MELDSFGETQAERKTLNFSEGRHLLCMKMIVLEKRPCLIKTNKCPVIDISKNLARINFRDFKSRKWKARRRIWEQTCHRSSKARTKQHRKQ